MIRYLFLTACLLYGLIAKSQAPVPQFSSNVQAGCAALSVTFKDLSTGTPKSWNWDLGNGQLSNQQNPSTVYYTPGTYTVRLVVRNADGTDGLTQADYITVFPAPYADYTADLTNVCLPGQINFQDKSTTPTGTISKWEWTFGDGTTANVPSPQHTYAATGYYNVSLKATSTTGCSYLNIKYNYIRVLSGVTADFNYGVDSVCRAPFKTTYTNLTSGPGNLSYSWNFGNGDLSTAPSPTDNFNAPGTYKVLLMAKSDYGCSDTVQKVITVASATTAFTNADSACLTNAVTFNNTSSPVPVSSAWDFGDGSVSPQTNPSKTYAAAGTYQVKVVNKYATCSDSVTRPVKILAPPQVDFSANAQYACKAPLTVTFNNLSPDAVTYAWNFGDGGTSVQRNPVYTYTKAGEYDVTLTITNAFGCKNNIIKSKFIRILPPAVSIPNTPAGGCIPFLFTPVAGIQAVDGVAGYQWDYGEGGGWTSAGSHTYTTQGNFTLKLRVTTQGGCSDSVTVPNGVLTGTLPVVDFKADTVQDCADSVVYFHDLTVPSGPVIWDFGDAANTATSTLKDPTHQFENPGKYTITLQANNNGCTKTLSKPQYITVLPPRPSFLFKVDCSDLLTVTFTDQSVVDTTKPISYFWQFGEPQIGSSTLKNPSFKFPSQGYYVIKLTVTNGNCANTINYPISFSRQKADFSIAPSDSLCRDQVFTYTAINSNPQFVAGYQWSVNGGAYTPAAGTITAKFDSNGTFPIKLIVKDQSGCSDTAVKTVTVAGPYPDFTTTDTVGCENALVAFKDLSTPVGTIVSWRFDFGDGTTQTFTKAPFNHVYKKAGLYDVTLTVQGIKGCTIGVTKNKLVRISKPVVAFQAQSTLYCPGSNLQLTDSSVAVGPSTYLWAFGDGTFSTLQNPTHAYPKKDTVYTVSLKVQDATGCADSLTKAKYIQVRVPSAAFTVTDSVAICPPLETKFFFKGTGYQSFYWDFGDSIVSTLMNPTHFYNAYGTYKARLILIGFGGCPDTSEHEINLYDPGKATISLNPLKACNSALVDFTIKVPPQTLFTLYFNDGASDNSQKDTLQHFYNSPGHYYPSLSMSDNLGCQVAVGAPSAVEILGASPFFSPDRKSFCDSGKVFFTNFTIGNDPVISNTWDFGDGNSSTETEPVHTYTKPGMYLVSLSVSTQSGCTKTMTDTIRVYATPDPSITSNNLVCLNVPLLLTGGLALPDSTITWNWDFGNGQTSSNQNPSVSYNKNGAYTITLKAINAIGCTRSVSKSIAVAALPSVTIQNAVVIPAGTSIPIPVTYGTGITNYNWTPVKGLSCIACPVPVASPVVTTRYTVSVTDSNGCANTGGITVTVACGNNNFFIPNTFTPNGDGSNDVFYPRGLGGSTVQSMRIFNRWGEMVFEKKNFLVNSQADGWNGIYKGQFAIADTYVYFIDFICANGEIIPYKGNITLIR